MPIELTVALLTLSPTLDSTMEPSPASVFMRHPKDINLLFISPFVGLRSEMGFIELHTQFYFESSL